MGDFRGFSSSPHCRRGSQLQNNTWYFTVLYPLEIKFHGWEIHGNPQSRHKISSYTYMFISVHLDAFLRIPKIFFHFFPAPSHSKKNEELIEVHLLPWSRRWSLLIFWNCFMVILSRSAMISPWHPGMWWTGWTEDRGWHLHSKCHPEGQIDDIGW